MKLTGFHILALIRVSICALLLLNFVGKFHAQVSEIRWPRSGVVPLFQILPFPFSQNTLGALEVLWAFALILGLIGLCTRPALFAAGLCGVLVLGHEFNWGRIFHSESLILQALLFLGLVRGAGEVWSVDQLLATWRSKRQARTSIKPSMTPKEALAALVGLQILVCLCYFSAGLSKFRRGGWEWALSENLAIDFFQQPFRNPLSTWFLDQDPWVLRTLAFSVLSLELLSWLPLWWTRARFFFLLSWGMLHLGVYMILGGHSLFFSQILLYPAFFLAADWQAFKEALWGAPNGFEAEHPTAEPAPEKSG